VASEDQCDTIEASYGITNVQFSSWNPYIDDSMSFPLLSLPRACTTLTQVSPINRLLEPLARLLRLRPRPWRPHHDF
jgi:hypothetical protein